LHRVFKGGLGEMSKETCSGFGLQIWLDKFPFVCCNFTQIKASGRASLKRRMDKIPENPFFSSIIKTLKKSTKKEEVYV
jgi:hypothetical protein